MEEFNYRGYTIQAQSYKNENGKWTPQAKVVHPKRGNTHLDKAPLTWSREFETQQQADDFAITGAQMYLDEQSY
jgi:hypothetical protein